uniref:F-box domain-containing protein n=1 Tax=Caenorhabditis tropicalis TaxID=1561998 RepID=A0A1I7UTH5_9PELO
MEFDFLRLPYVAIREVLMRMSLKEQFLFSILSKLSKWLVKSIKQETHVSLPIIGFIEFSNQNELIHVQSQDHDLSIYFWNDLPENLVFWNKPHNVCIQHLVDVFKSKVHVETFESDYRKNLEFLEELHVNIHSVNGSTEYLQETLDAFNRIKRVELLHTKTSSEEIFQLKDSYHFDFIKITNCDNALDSANRRSLLLSLINCKKVIIQNVIYRIQDLVDFLGRWICGSKVEHMQIHFDRDDFNAIIFEKLGQVNQVTSAVVGGEKISSPCFLIKQQGTGREAIVYTNDYVVILTTDFKIFM